MLAADSYSIIDAMLVTAGGLVSGVGILTALTKIPGTRWLFKRLVVAPYAEWHDQRMNQKIAEAVGLQADVVRQQVQEQIAPVALEVKQINEAVNNVGPAHPKLKDRVGYLEQGQKAMNWKLDVITEMVESLVQRG